MVTSWKIVLWVSTACWVMSINSKETQINLLFFCTAAHHQLLDNSHNLKVPPHLQLCVHRHKYITPVGHVACQRAINVDIARLWWVRGFICPDIQLLTAEKPGTENNLNEKQGLQTEEVGWLTLLLRENWHHSHVCIKSLVGLCARLLVAVQEIIQPQLDS